MNGSGTSPYLVKLADLFRQEGDSETADALMRRSQVAGARSLGSADRQRVAELQREGLRLEGIGDHERAEPLLAQALEIVEACVGPNHVEVIDHLSDLARCRFNDGDYGPALTDYARLLRIVEQARGSDDVLARMARQSMARCKKRLREAHGARLLHAHVYWMLQRATGARSVEAFTEQERIRNIARRLMARGRHALSLRLYSRWISLQLRAAPPDGDLALLDIREHVSALRTGGELPRAARQMGSVVLMRNRRSVWDSDTTEFLQDLSLWQSCLEELGQHRSAAETAALAASIVASHRTGATGSGEHAPATIAMSRSTVIRNNVRAVGGRTDPAA